MGRQKSHTIKSYYETSKRGKMNSRSLIPSFVKFVQFSKAPTYLRATQSSVRCMSSDESCGKSKAADKKALVLREKTPIGKLEELEGASHPYQEKEPLKPFPGGVNPKTGEVGGPKGPEPTRFGDWERKGRVSDF